MFGYSDRAISENLDQQFLEELADLFRTRGRAGSPGGPGFFRAHPNVAGFAFVFVALGLIILAMYIFRSPGPLR
jgi:hypothetical protein